MALPTSTLQRRVHFIPVGSKDAIVALEGSVGFKSSLIQTSDLPGWDEHDWDSVIDFTVRGGKDGGVFYGNDNRSFVVPVRSGAAWTNRVILTCL